MIDPLPRGASIGILGGGQLGRMLSVAGARLGFRTHVYDPGPVPPAGHVAEQVTTAGYDDTAALETFGSTVDVITYEFENVPTSALDLLESMVPIRPGREALRISQDRIIEKDFLSSLDLDVAPYAAADDAVSLESAIAHIGTPAILKTRRFGYDGKGQALLAAPEDAETALSEMAGAPAILERFIDFDLEISVIVARGLSGEISCFDPGENVHIDGILRTTKVPASIDRDQLAEAIAAARRIVEALGYVGVLGIEFFVTVNGLVVNEIAPRVHNSGHWTQNGCAIDQFEQHVRAITGWPLGDGSRHSDVIMENLIGHDLDQLPELAASTDLSLHLYGKTEIKPGRKMGHTNRVTGPALPEHR